MFLNDNIFNSFSKAGVFLLLLLISFFSNESFAEEPIKLSCTVNGTEHSELNGYYKNKTFNEPVFVDIYIFSTKKSNVSNSFVTMININSSYFNTPVINNLDDKVKKVIDNSNSSTWAIFNDQDDETQKTSVEVKLDRNTGILKAYNNIFYKPNGTTISVELNGVCEKTDSSKLKF